MLGVYGLINSDGMVNYTEAKMASLSVWWEPVAVKSDQCWRYSVGPLQLYLQRREQDWLIGWQEREDIEAHHWAGVEQIDEIPLGLETERFVFQSVPDHFCLKPCLLDRPVVVKNLQPVHLPPDAHITFYISSPVCVAVELFKPVIQAKVIPTLRLSDTWFGPSTREGEFCYAARTHARSSVHELPKRPHRAVTPVTVYNHSHEVMTIDKLSIPVPYLCVYGTAEGMLWTDPVSLKHTAGSSLSVLEVGKHLPSAMVQATRLTEPRMTVQRGSLVRAFASMFSH